MNDTKHAGTPPDFKKYINPEQRKRWESDLQDWLDDDRDPNRETRAAFWFLLELKQYETSYAALAEENALLRKALRYISSRTCACVNNADNSWHSERCYVGIAKAALEQK